MEPFIPGTAIRFHEPTGRLLDIQREIRRDVQEGGQGLYVYGVPGLYIGGTEVFTVAEAWARDNLPLQFVARQLDPYRMADLQDGRRVVIQTLPLRGSQPIFVHGAIVVYGILRWSPLHLVEIRRNNRQTRSWFEHGSAHSIKLAIQNANEAEQRPVYDEFSDAYAEAMKDSMEYALGKPHVRGGV